MKKITPALKNKIVDSYIGLKKIPWNDIYDNEDELIKDMFNEKVKISGMYYDLCKGYEYIEGFRNYFKKHNCLTEKQIMQLKRLSVNIAYNVYCK